MGVPSASAEVLREVFGGLNRALKRMSIYRHASEQHAGYLEPVLASFRAALDHQPSVQVEVLPGALVFQGVSVHSETPREWGLCFRLHRDGVRSLTFRRGLTLEELLTFCGVALFDPQAGPGPGREDAVTELWKADLAGIAYTATAGYNLEHGEVDARLVAQAVESIRRRARPLLESLPPPASALAAGTAMDAWAPLPAREGLELPGAEEWAAVAQRSANALLRVVEQGFAGRDLEALTEALWRLIDELLARNEAASLGRTLEALRKLGGSHGSDFRAAVSRSLAEPARLRRLLLFAGTEPKALELVLPLWLSLLPREAAPPLLEALAQAPEPALGQLARAAVARADSALEHLGRVLQAGAPPAALALLGALDGLSPGTRAELAAPALKNPAVGVRLEAVAAVGGDAETAVHLLGPALAAPESSVRMAAAGALAACASRAEAAAEVLLQTLAADAFAEREPDERTFFYRALGRLGSGPGFAFLTSLLNENKGLFRKRPAEEERLMAVVGLAEEGTPRALRALDAASDPSAGQPPVVAASARAAAARLRAPQARPARNP